MDLCATTCWLAAASYGWPSCWINLQYATAALKPGKQPTHPEDQDPEAEDPDQQDPGKRSSLTVQKQLGGEGGPGLLDSLDGLLLAGPDHHHHQPQEPEVQGGGEVACLDALLS